MVFMRANSNSSPGPDEMRPSHIRSVITTDVGHEEVAEAFARLWELTYISPDSLPLEFWTLHTNSRLFAIGELLPAGLSSEGHVLQLSAQTGTPIWRNFSVQ
ncbi:unnamed protein product [Choristocarpus tenellus]